MVQTNKELRIEDYYDAERNEIIDFPPPSEDFLSKVRPIVKRMKDGNKNELTNWLSESMRAIRCDYPYGGTKIP